MKWIHLYIVLENINEKQKPIFISVSFDMSPLGGLISSLVILLLLIVETKVIHLQRKFSFSEEMKI